MKNRLPLLAYDTLPWHHVSGKLWYQGLNYQAYFLYIHYNQVLDAALSNLIQHVLFCCHCQAETFWWPTQHRAKTFFQLCKFQQTISHYSTTKLLQILYHYLLVQKQDQYYLPYLMQLRNQKNISNYHQPYY